ncbi:MAG: isoaspartyl peptidase/L-asparaginase [Ignavibacteriaceae bacterium]|nr:isoaspartyl peptidase/L-asparaginase [Ignavibacteriaceae bacterium]
MNKLPVVLLSLILTFFLLNNSFAQNDNANYIIVIHGGAGFMNEMMPESEKAVYYTALEEALNIGKTILENNGSSLDAVEKVVRFLEDHPGFNAGKGAVYTSEGKHELDASIMFGKDLSCGAVAGVTIIKNPISLARLVMEKTPHVLFAGTGADELGKKFGVELVENSYFDTEKAYQEYLRSKENVKGTVGCVALDKFGNISAATSTGGRTNKMPGRVGDSPLVNAGTYANNNTCGVSATGWGELFIRNTVAFNISALMEYKGYTLQQACDEMIRNRLPEGTGGVIAVDKNGNYYFSFNTKSMLRGVATSSGIFETKIWHDR